MNWGTKIVIVIVSFVLFMIGMVTICMKQTDLDLVSKDYYEQEIAYQQTLDRIENTNRLGVRPVVNGVTGAAIIDYSGIRNYSAITGVIHFFRPSDDKLDFRVQISPATDGRQYVSHHNLIQGKWIVKISWEYDDLSYYNEEQISIQ